MLLLLSLLVCVVAFVCIYIRSAFSVKEILINYPSHTESVRGYESFYSTFLPLVSEKNVQESIVAQNPGVSTVYVEKIYPNKLFIKIVAEGPSVSLKVGNEYVLLTSIGRVLQKVKTKPTNIPEIIYYQELFKEDVKIEDVLSFKDLQIAIQFIRILRTLGYKVIQVDIDSFYMIRLVLEDSREVLVTTEKNIQKQEYQISSILRQFKVDGTKFKRLDVRFDKPVMTK